MKRRVIFLREEKENDKYRSLFNSHGFDVEFKKVLETRFVNQDGLEQMLHQYDSFGGMIVTSQNASRAIAKVDPSKWKLVYTVGSATGDSVRKLGLNSVGECGNADGLAMYIISNYKDKKPLLFLTGDKTRDVLPIKLKEAGIAVQELQVYETTNLSKKLDISNEILVLFSPSGLDSIEITDNSWVSIGPTTTAALKQRGIVPYQATSPSPSGVLDAVLEYLKSLK